MINGFVTSYKDTNNFIHLYFYPGIDDEGNNIYNEIDLKKCGVEYEEIHYQDGGADFKFVNKHITKIHCKLVKPNGECDIKNLKI